MGTFTDWARLAQMPLGNVCLAAPSQSRQEEVIHPVLFTPGLVENVGVELLLAKLLQDLAFLTRQFVGLETLLPLYRKLLAFDLKFVTLLFQPTLPFVGVLQVNRSDAADGFRRT